jgi:ADP-ribose pyrophosphatase YjhB (NUDIX family)
VPRLIEGQTLEACPNDDFVLWRDPKVVTSVIVSRGAEIALGRRTIEPGRGLWCLPGGFVNHDEAPDDAARRECVEEIRAEVEITRLIGVYHMPKTDAASLIGIAYEARLPDGAAIEPGSEMAEVGFFGADALPPLAFPSHRALVAEFFRSLGLAVEAETLNGGAAAPHASRPSPARAPRRPPRRR